MHYSFKSTPTWTLRTRPQTSDSKNPGPSDYIIKKPLPNSGSVSAITQTRNLYKKIETFPGPGTYNSKSYISEGPKRSMSARYFQTAKPSPGPHEYQNNTLKVKNKAPRFSMSTRSKSYHQLTIDKNLYTPGPTRYQNKSTLDNPNGFVIGQSTRKDLTETQKTPAPNFYQSQKSKDYTLVLNKKCIMGTEFRKTTGFMEVEKTPGPDHYNSLSSFENNKQKKAGFSCRQKTADLIAQQISKFPGPGEYESHLNNKNRAPRIANPQTLRKTFMDDMQDFKKPYPSPDKYDATMRSSKYNSVKVFNFCKSNRKPLDENQKTPGPSYYQNKKIDAMVSAPKFSVSKTIAKNQFLGLNPEIPAPCAYNPKLNLIKQSTRNYQVSKQKRPDFQKHKFLPGPGDYNLRGRAGTSNGWVFSKQQRIAFTDQKSQSKNGTHYNIPQKVVDPPKYMNVQSKIKYQSPQKTSIEAFNTAYKSVESQAV